MVPGCFFQRPLRAQPQGLQAAEKIGGEGSGEHIYKLSRVMPHFSSLTPEYTALTS